MYLGMLESRVTEFSDASAVGRTVLYYYGLQLAMDNPFGYGWGFHASEFAWLYWEHLAGMPKSDGAFRLEIHNAFINFILIYGLYGLAVLLVTVVLAPRVMLATAIVAVGYFVNAIFHNGGIFMGDNWFWIAFAMVILVWDHKRIDQASSSPKHAHIRLARVPV